MAVQLCSEAAASSTWVPVTSPRISFSQDLSQSDGSIPVDRHGLDPTFLDSDFKFSIRCEQESSSADELFSGGKILPLLFKDAIAVRRPNSIMGTPHLPKPSSATPPSPMQPSKDAKRESLREVMAISDAEEKHPPPKSFWRFTRSSSLNLGSGYKTICSLPLLSRSNSTGSINLSSRRPPPPPPPPPPKENHKSLKKPASSQKQKPTATTTPPLFQRAASKKNSRNRKTQLRAYGNGVRISPVLNVPPYIPKGTTGLFCFGFFCNGKYAKSKKKSSAPSCKKDIQNSKNSISKTSTD